VPCRRKWQEYIREEDEQTWPGGCGPVQDGSDEEGSQSIGRKCRKANLETQEVGAAGSRSQDDHQE